jgi:hypothetical protein
VNPWSGAGLQACVQSGVSFQAHGPARGGQVARAPELNEKRERGFAELRLELTPESATRLEKSKADGLPTPGLDATLAGDPTGEWSLAPQDELLARHAMAYAVTAELLLAKVGWHPPDSTQLGTSPSPQNVIMWYHLFLALKTRRSLVAAHRATRGRPCAEDDARGSAKIALISIDRSREALWTLARGRVRSLARHLVVMLDVLAAGLEARVPGARCFVRPGLDDRA